MQLIEINLMIQTMKNFLCAKNMWYAIACLLLIIVSNNVLMYSGSKVSIHAVLLMVLLLIVLSSNKYTFRLLACPLVVALSLYLPIGYMYGGVNFNYFVSFYATDILEGYEFLSTLPIGSGLVALLTLILFVEYRRICNKHHFLLYQNRWLMMLIVIAIVATSKQFSFFDDGLQAYKTLQVEREKLEAARKTFKDQWGGVQVNSTASRYDDYVVVIGESARKDYLHVYGYPIANTPFLSKVNGVFVDGLKSADTHTVTSLSRMLTANDKKSHAANYNMDVVTLAKKAGFQSYWISNQGYLGIYDTPISLIAERAENHQFLKSADNETHNGSDFAIIDIFKKQLTNPTRQKRVFFLHLYGSHNDACKRITDFHDDLVIKDPSYAYMSCYVKSIHKTDVFLSKIYQQLQQNKAATQREFSMVYFSDHGLTASDNHIMVSSGKSKQHYDVPLIKLSSDDDQRQMIHQQKSGYYFVDGLANWMGITNDKLYHYDLFGDEQPDFVVDFPPFHEQPDNPVIDITGK